MWLYLWVSGTTGLTVYVQIRRFPANFRELVMSKAIVKGAKAGCYFAYYRYTPVN